MYEEIVTRLRAEAECPDNYQEDSELMREAADAIEELSRAQEQWINQERNALLKSIPKWIPVTERLPENFKRVLIAVNLPGHEPVQLDTCFHDYGEIYLDGGYEFFTEVTHWMPLPAPPKEET